THGDDRHPARARRDAWADPALLSDRELPAHERRYRPRPRRRARDQPRADVALRAAAAAVDLPSGRRRRALAARPARGARPGAARSGAATRRGDAAALTTNN